MQTNIELNPENNRQYEALLQLTKLWTDLNYNREYLYSALPEDKFQLYVDELVTRAHESAEGLDALSLEYLVDLQYVLSVFHTKLEEINQYFISVGVRGIPTNIPHLTELNLVHLVDGTEEKVNYDAACYRMRGFYNAYCNLSHGMQPPTEPYTSSATKTSYIKIPGKSHVLQEILYTSPIETINELINRVNDNLESLRCCGLIPDQSYTLK